MKYGFTAVTDERFKYIIEHFLNHPGATLEEIVEELDIKSGTLVTSYLKNKIRIERVCGKEALQQVEEKLEQFSNKEDVNNMYDDHAKEVIDSFLMIEPTSDCYRILAEQFSILPGSIRNNYLGNEQRIIRLYSKEILEKIKEKRKFIKDLQKKEKLQQKINRNMETYRNVISKFLAFPSDDISAFVSTFHLSTETVIVYICDDEVLEKLYDEKTHLEIMKKRTKAQAYIIENKKFDKKRKQLQNILSELLETYYPSHEVFRHYKVKESSIRSFIIQYEYYTGYDLEDSVKEHLNHRNDMIFAIQKYKLGNKKEGFFLIQEKDDIIFLKEGKYDYSLREYKILQTVKSYLKHRGDMKQVIRELGKTYVAVYTDLTYPLLKDMLKPEIFHELSGLVEIETILHNNDSLKEKHNFIKNVFYAFRDHQYSIEKVSEITGLSGIAICKVLEDPYIKFLDKNPNIVNIIKEEIDAYKESESFDKKTFLKTY